MSRIAILEPTTLLGREVRETLERQPGPPHDLVLLTTDTDEVGAVTEAYGGAALVARAEPGALDGVDLVLACGSEAASSRELLAGRPVSTTALVLSPNATPRDGRAVVAGVNDDSALPGELLRSPHPAAVALAQLVFPLVPLGLESAVATLVQPVSVYGQDALEELFDQTRNIIAMVSAKPSRFERQLAFNLYPAPDVEPGAITAVLGELELPAGVEVAAELVQAATFHGVAASVLVRFGAGAPDVATIGAALTANRRAVLDLDAEDRPGLPGPVEAATDDRLIVGGVRAAQGMAGAFWIWAVIDNLTRGGALNAIEVASRLLSLPRA